MKYIVRLYKTVTGPVPDATREIEARDDADAAQQANYIQLQEGYVNASYTSKEDEERNRIRFNSVQHRIRKWMKAHLQEHIDECNEVNATSLTEAWDRDQSTGSATLDEDHVAWTIAAEVASEYENGKG